MMNRFLMPSQDLAPRTDIEKVPDAPPNQCTPHIQRQRVCTSPVVVQLQGGEEEVWATGQPQRAWRRSLF